MKLRNTVNNDGIWDAEVFDERLAFRHFLLFEFQRSTGIRTSVVDDAVSCAAYGAGKMLGHLDDMQDGMMNFFRKRQLKG